MSNKSEPTGEMILRTLAMAKDTNINGDIFGGWIMSQMDIAGGIMAKEVSKGRVVTVAVDSMQFIKPVQVGDVVCCYGQVVKKGRTSITIKLEIWISSAYQNKEKSRYQVTEANFVYVAVDDTGIKRVAF